MKSKKKFLHNILLPKKENYFYPLSDDNLSKDDLNAGIKVLKSKKITMGDQTSLFEKIFAKKFNSQYALMVNSGSSANLLSVFASCNPMRKNRFKRGDHAIIQSLCWPTSLWPLVQAGLKINFVDVDPKTLNVRADEVINMITKKTKVILIINVLGLSTDIKKIRRFCNLKKIILIEDNCEALGAKFDKKYLGTFGDFGTYSFYYSHQITAGEGGMIVCNDKKNYEIIHSLRAHGWDRGLRNNKEKNFNFINSGFNLRPTDIAAAIGFNQFKRLNNFKKIRTSNIKKIIKKLKRSKSWENQFTFIEPVKNLEPSWFGLPILINKNFVNKKRKFLSALNKNGIETRPIISGNFLNQPSIKLYKLNSKKILFKGAQEVENRGFFIGIHIENITNKDLNFLEKNLLKISKI